MRLSGIQAVTDGDDRVAALQELLAIQLTQWRVFFDDEHTNPGRRSHSNRHQFDGFFPSRKS